MWIEHTLKTELFESDNVTIINDFPDRVLLKHKSKLTSAVIVTFLISSGVVETENIGEHWERFRVVFPSSNSSGEVWTGH